MTLARKFLVGTAALAMLAPAASVAQNSISSNSSSSQSTSPDSPYPGWAAQAGPIAPIPFSKFSAGVSLTANDFQGSVQSAPATPGILDLSLDDAIRRGLDSNLAIRLRREQQNIARGERNLALQGLLPALTASGSTSLSQVDLATEGFRASTLGGHLPPGLKIPQIIEVQTTSGQGNLNWSAFNISAWRRYQAARLQQSAAADITADSQQQ